MTTVAAVTSAVLFLSVAGFQAVLALGAPLGAHVLGGRYSGTLPRRMRVFSGITALILVGAGLIVLARAGILGWPAGANWLLAPATWVIASFLALNTLGNRTSRSRFERTIFAPTTAALAVLCAYVALTGSDSPGPG